MKYEILKFEDMEYVLRFPKDYATGEKRPVIIFLHGAGSRKSEIDALLTNPCHTLTEQHGNFPFITVAPHCVGDENTWFDLLETLKRFVRFISSSDFTDPERLYCMGPSMGGYGTWQLGMSMPEYFAAIVPICGGGMYWNAHRLANVPVWAFHGELDTCVLPEESVKLVERINQSGGSAKLTLYPDCAHHAWVPTYNNPEVFKWLLEHKNENAKELLNMYNNAEKFG